MAQISVIQINLCWSSYIFTYQLLVSLLFPEHFCLLAEDISFCLGLMTITAYYWINKHWAWQICVCFFFSHINLIRICLTASLSLFKKGTRKLLISSDIICFQVYLLLLSLVWIWVKWVSTIKKFFKFHFFCFFQSIVPLRIVFKSWFWQWS